MCNAGYRMLAPSDHPLKLENALSATKSSLVSFVRSPSTLSHLGICIFYLCARRPLIHHRPPSIHFMPVDGAHKRSPSHCHRQFNILLSRWSDLKWCESETKWAGKCDWNGKTGASATKMVAVCRSQNDVRTYPQECHARIKCTLLSNGIQCVAMARDSVLHTIANNEREGKKNIQIVEKIIKISFALDGLAESCRNIFKYHFREAHWEWCEHRCCHWL